MNSYFDRFDPHARKVMQLATVEAQRMNSECIGTGHILLSLLSNSNSENGDGKISFRGELEAVRREVAKLVELAPYSIVGKVPLNQCATKAVEYALSLTNAKLNQAVSTIHLFVAILQDDDSDAVRVLHEIGLPPNIVLDEARTAIATEQSDAPKPPVGCEFES